MATPEYKSLNADRIVATIERLSERIAARFPDAGLYDVCLELLSIARKAKRRSEKIQRPIYWVRAAVLVLVVLFLLGVREAVVQHLVVIGGVEMINQLKRFDQLLPLVDAGTNVLIVLGAALLFLTTMETRVKRSRALVAIHELRAIAHIIDMHQLTKEPERVMSTIIVTDVSPSITMSPAEMSRYLDYCSEMLALTGKLAALYVQEFGDPVALAAVNEVESLTTGLSRKIWQKMTMLHQVAKRSPATET